MRCRHILSMLISVFCFQVLWADEIVLQNGTNNYDGCEDAWIFGAYYNQKNQKGTNYGNETKLSLFWMNDGSRGTLPHR